jgi:hypothetical protein
VGQADPTETPEGKTMSTYYLNAGGAEFTGLIAKTTTARTGTSLGNTWTCEYQYPGNRAYPAYPLIPSITPPISQPEVMVMKKQSDVLLVDAEGTLLKTCDDMKEAEREARRLAVKHEDEIRIVRCVKVVRPKTIEVETEEV